MLSKALMIIFKELVRNDYSSVLFYYRSCIISMEVLENIELAIIFG